MAISSISLATTIRLEGALFSRDFIARLGAAVPDLSQLTPQSYGLAPEEKLREAISASWNTLSARWDRFKTERDRLPEGDYGVALTRREWLLPVLQELGFGRVQPAAAIRLVVGEESKDYALSHGWDRTPLHLLGAGVSLDVRTPHVPGAAQLAPHALVQECLNRSSENLWAVLSNGLKWRLLRDSAAIARRSYVEFDLEAIFESENTADFAVFWLLCHASRFEWRAVESNPEEESETVVQSSAQPPILEQWLQGTDNEGQRARLLLRAGVQEAIETLASGFVRHAANGELREQLRTGELAPLEFYKLSLRLVYRILFLLVAEAKEALLRKDAEAEARRRYADYYALSRLRTRAGKTRGTTHGDAWQGLRLTFGFFRDGEPGLAIPALGGILFEATILDRCEIANEDLLAAMRALCFFQDGGARRQVNFNLGSEELGGVYESLLELSPRLDLDARRFALETLAGNERKTTGSHYTPEILVKSLLDTALEPVLERAAKAGEAAILALRVCDWSSGSGHFLTAAARRIAERLALLRTGGDEPSLDQLRHALREVVGHCIYGVDLNPMAVELCKIALWMEGLEPGKPLSFLDAHIRCGNSLLGATPELLEAGIPDEAFAPIEGDDRKACTELKQQNRSERAKKAKEKAGQGKMDFGNDWDVEIGDLRSSIQKLEAIDDSVIDGVREKERMLSELSRKGSYRYTHLLADAWCAAFVWPKRPITEEGNIAAITDSTLDRIRHNARAGEFQEQEIQRLREQYKWFHPHLEFPEIYTASTCGGGFDVNLGNPPWERVKLQEKEWFAQRSPQIANAPNAAARKRLIDDLTTNDPLLHQAFLDDKRRAEGESHFARSSGRYPLCGRGDVNTYALFAELNRNLINDGGRAGIIVQSDIAISDTNKYFFQDLIAKKSLISFFDFVNTEGLFPHMHRTHPHFCLLTLAAKVQEDEINFSFWNTNTATLADTFRQFRLSTDEIALLNPNTKTCPIFRSSIDAELTKAIYRRVPILIKEERGEEGNPWGIKFSTMFHMSNDSGLFETREQLESDGYTLRDNVFERPSSTCSEWHPPLAINTLLPLYEAKMLHHFDHRWATYDGGDTRDVTPEEKANPDFIVQPRYWVNENHVENKLQDRWDKSWLLGFRDITNTTNERTVIASVLPRVAVGHTAPLIMLNQSTSSVLCLLASLSAFAFDYVARQKVGGTHLTYGLLNQLPVLPPSTCSAWISSRVLELTYTAHDMEPFARDLKYFGPPFAWDVERRFQLRCELDAAFFHLYGLTRDEAAYVLDTFPIVRRKDERDFGTYRTKTEILKLYDAMAAA